MSEAGVNSPAVDTVDPPSDSKEKWIRWMAEIRAAEEEAKTWHERGDKVVKRFLDDRDDGARDGKRDIQRLNLFTANTQTMEALLFGKTPDVGVERRYADSADDVARVASEMLERLLNADIESDTDTQQEALRHALSDRLLPGFGSVRLRYEIGETAMSEGTPAQTGPDGAELAPAVQPVETRPEEQVCLDYVHWKDEVWSPARVYGELRWRAWRAKMSRDQLVKRFGDKVGKAIALDSKKDTAGDNVKSKDYLARADVWEVWSKDDETVYWVSPGHPDLLDKQPDPLEIDGFWPSPRPMFANLTTSKLMPTPDFAIAQDLYDEIDDMATRAVKLERCIRVRFLYDKNNEELKRLLTEGSDNDGIAVDGWAAFAEKNGIEGAVSWLPLEMMTQALDVLNNQIDRKIAQLFQITGMSDIMRGQASEQTTATEQAIKARFASVRVQTMQDEFARFASDTQRLKAQIISKHFDPQTIIDRSNIMRTPDAQLAQQAVQLIKGEFDWRVVVNPDSVSLTDFAALKAERFEFASALSGYFQSMMPFVQMIGSASPAAVAPTVQFVIGLAQQMTAGLKGSQEMEGIFDQFVAELEEAAQKPTPTPQPDPKLEAAKVKAQAEGVKAKADMQQTQIDGQVHMAKAGMDMQVAKEKHQMDMQKIGAGILSEEAKARAQAVEGVNKVTQEGPT